MKKLLIAAIIALATSFAIAKPATQKPVSKVDEYVKLYNSYTPYEKQISQSVVFDTYDTKQESDIREFNANPTSPFKSATYTRAVENRKVVVQYVMHGFLKNPELVNAFNKVNQPAVVKSACSDELTRKVLMGLYGYSMEFVYVDEVSGLNTRNTVHLRDCK